ncbi:MAG: CAP domain-containing protein [Pseudomonadota bacterium]
MIRLLSVLIFALAGLAACSVPSSEPQIGADGRPLPKLYRIRAGDTAKLQFRMLDSVNALRSAQNLPPVELNAQLNAAAATHSRDMAVQNRPWHFGSDGSSPIDRLQRVGYAGRLVGENIAETYETELEVLAAWMEQPDTRRTVMSSDARQMGFAWHQETNGKIWWTLVTGNPAAAPLIPAANPSASRLVPAPTTPATEEEPTDLQTVADQLS